MINKSKLDKNWTLLWLLFISFSWSFFYIVNRVLDFSPIWNIIIIILGLIFYYFKLKKDGLNNGFFDLNFKIIFYYLYIYFHYILISTIIAFFFYYQIKHGYWKEKYILFNNSDKIIWQHYIRYILFFSNAMTGSLILVKAHDMNYFLKDKLGSFNNNVNLISAVFVASSLCLWVITQFYFVTIFIVAITVATLPEWIDNLRLSFFLKLRRIKIPVLEYKKLSLLRQQIEEEQLQVKRIEYNIWLENMKKSNIYKWYILIFLRIVFFYFNCVVIFVTLFIFFLYKEFFILEFFLNWSII